MIKLKWSYSKFFIKKGFLVILEFKFIAETAHFCENILHAELCTKLKNGLKYFINKVVNKTIIINFEFKFNLTFV